MKLSVITPIYNVEPYLEQCLDSLAQQTLHEIEFICINDGSTDGSLEILKKYAERDQRFVVVDKPNSGYGNTMNTGLQLAKGEWIGILESDDFANPDMFERLYTAAEREKCDIVKCNHYKFSDNTNSIFSECFPKDRCGCTFDPHSQENWFIFHTTPSIWAGVYNREFLEKNRIKFLETPGASFQDTGFVFKGFISASSIYLMHDALIHYRIDREGSSVNGRDKVYCVAEEYEEIHKFLNAHPSNDKSMQIPLYGEQFNAYLWNASRLMLDKRLEFLKYTAELYRGLLAHGKLDEAGFRHNQYETCKLLCDNTEAFLARESILYEKSNRPKVSVIMPVYNIGDDLHRSFRSLLNQTMGNFEVIIIDDGSVDNSQEIIISYLNDKRFKYICQENAGVSSARNKGLEIAKGEFIAFLDGGDGFTNNALEKLLRAINLNKADMSIGEIKAFTVVRTTVYEVTRRHSKMERIEPYDSSFIYSNSVNNKLFKNAIIKDFNLRFKDFVNGEDGVFLFEYLNHTKKCVGCGTQVYSYKKNIFFEQQTATSSTDLMFIESLMKRTKALRGIIEKGMASRINGAVLENDHALENELIAAKLTLLNALYERNFCYLVDSYYAKLWLLSDEAYKHIRTKLEEYRELVPRSRYPWIDQNLARFYCENAILPDKEYYVENPRISIILAPSVAFETAEKQLLSLYCQSFIAFEVFAPLSLKEFLSVKYSHVDNLQYILDSDELYLERALTAAKSPFVNILEDDIYHNDRSLDFMHKGLNRDYFDFVAFNQMGIKLREDGMLSIAKLRSLRQVFLDKYVGPNPQRTPLNKLDFSPNNKGFRKEVLINYKEWTHDLNDLSRLVADAYEKLSFKKDRNRDMISFYDDSIYFERGGKGLALKFYIDNARRYLKSQAFQNKKKKLIKQLSAKSNKAKSLDNKILFLSNRADGNMPDNLRMIYDALSDVKKEVIVQRLPHSKIFIKETLKAISTAKVIVTDDYIHFLKSYRKKKGQYIIQLWHACGALKKFSLHNPGCDIRNERALHRQYDMVSVSSEKLRALYADAFGIHLNKTRAFGVPRTDSLLDEQLSQKSKTALIHQFPELEKKKLILYCPTFRQRNGYYTHFNPRINWSDLSNKLPKDCVLLVKKHPLERTVFFANNYSNVIDVSELNIQELTLACDMLMTDYSSVLFEFLLINKPVVIYFPDAHENQTGFYFDLHSVFSDVMIESPTDIPSAIKSAMENGVTETEKMLISDQLSACDGQSTQRIADYIKDLIV